MSVTSTPAGLYGKLPSRGDFVTRNLPRSFVDPWDRWLQASIKDSRAQLGEDWLDIYLTSPLWRYALSPGICGEDTWIGVLMPSVDGVGRYFPLTLNCRLGPQRNPLRLMAELDAWYAQAEALILSTLDDDFNLNGFAPALVELGGAGLDEGAAATTVPERIDDSTALRGWRVRLAALTSLPDCYPELASEVLREVFFAFGVWATNGSEQTDPSLLVCQGLPPVDGYASMLLGEWTGDSITRPAAHPGPAPDPLEADTQPPRGGAR